MTQLRLVPPDGADWTIAAHAIAGGVQLELDVPAQGIVLTLDLTREEARAYARAILAAAGDATERTFPRPAEKIDG